MGIKKYFNGGKLIVYKGVEKMNVCTLRNNKVALKALLMKNVKTDTQGRVLIGKDDEWREETEWDTLYEEISSKEGN